MALLAAISGSAIATPSNSKVQLQRDRDRAIAERLLRAVERDPSVVTRSWFLHKASLVNFELPVTIRLLPARDGTPHFKSNDEVGNYATLDLGASLGTRVIGLGGSVNALVHFKDSFDSDGPGNVDIELLADDASVQSTSIGLLTNPDVSARTAGRNHVDVLDLGGAAGGTFGLRWVDPDGVAHDIPSLSPLSLDAASLTAALQAALGGNNIFAAQVGPGRFEITFSGRYTDPAGGLASIQIANNLTGSPISVTTAEAGRASEGGCVGFADNGAGSDVDALDRLRPSLDPGTDNLGPNSQWEPLGGTNERDVVLRTGPLSLGIDHVGEAEVPAGDIADGTSGNRAATHVVGRSGGKANLFGLPVDGLGNGESVDVTVNLSTKVSAILRQVDNAFPQPSGLPDETTGQIASYFDCRQVWSGYVVNHLAGIQLTGQLRILPALTADGRLRIAKVFLSSPIPSAQAVVTCLVPYALFASGNTNIGDSSFTSSDPWSTNPIGPNLIGGVANSAHFDPRTTLNPSESASAPDVPCDSTGGPLDRQPFNFGASGGIDLTSLLRSGAATAVRGDLTVQKLVGEVIIGHAPAPPPAPTGPSPAEQIVAGARITPGKASLLGRTTCAARSFHAVVKGKNLTSVVFRLDGRVVDRFPNVISNTATLRVDPRDLSYGRHTVTARVTFKAGSGTKPETLRLSFRRCHVKVTPPQFTG